MKKWIPDIGKTGKNLTNLLCFELVYRGAATALVFQGARILFNAALKQMGYSYLTAENYMVFLSNPLTMLLIVLFALFILTALFFELCVISEALFLGCAGESCSITGLAVCGFWRFRTLVKKNGPLCLVLAAMTGIFACAHFMIREIMEVKILNYAFLLIYKWGNDKYFLIVLLALFAVLSIATMFSFTILAGKEDDIRTAFRTSIPLFVRHWKRALAAVLLCSLGVTLVMLVLYYLLMFAGAVAVALFEDSHFAMTALFSLNDTVSMIMGFLSGAVGILANMTVITGMYAGLEGVPVPEASYRAPKPAKARRAFLFFLLIFCVEAAYLYSAVVKGTQLATDLYAGILVTAHRGGAKDAPENTLAALSMAMENRSDYAEIDIQETKDKELILMHDNSLKRTAKVNRKVWEVTLSEVLEMEAGSHFNADYAGEKIPQLREALELCRGRLDLNIEVKSNGHNQEVAEKTAMLVTELGMEEQCIISSMNYSFLKDVKEVNPNIRTGYIMSVAYGKVESLEYADFLSVEYDCVTDDFVKRVHEAGKELHVWTVNSRKVMRRMKALGVDNIITDRPGVVREILMEDKSDAGFLELLRFVLE